jgi:hypothetical protein
MKTTLERVMGRGREAAKDGLRRYWSSRPSLSAWGFQTGWIAMGQCAAREVSVSAWTR